MKRNNNSQMVYLALILFTFFLPIQIFAGEPTKKETIEFIMGKADNFIYKYHKSDGTDESTQLLRFDGCNLVRQDLYHKSNGYRQDYKLYVDLSKLDPSTGELLPNSSRIQFLTKERKEVVKVESKGNRGDGYQQYQDAMQLETKSREDGEKLIKAFRHLIKLCGGTEELF